MIRTPPIRAVFFDAVGTLIHPRIPAPTKYASVASAYGFDHSEDEIRIRFLNEFRRQELIDREHGWITSEARELERWRHIVASTIGPSDACFQELFDHYAKPEAWIVDIHAASVFSTLRSRGVVLGLASNYDSRLEHVIAGHPDLLGLRPNILISSQVGHRKPSQAFFHSVLSTVRNFMPSEVAFVGDDFENDYEGATAAGMLAILIDPKQRGQDGLCRISTLAELVTPDTLG